MLAILHAVTKWRPYLIGQWFTIRTDQRRLPYFMEQRVHTPAQQWWVTKLLGYDYELVYKKGIENRAADALSRQPDTSELASFSAPTSLISSDLWRTKAEDHTMEELESRCKDRFPNFKP